MRNNKNSIKVGQAGNSSEFKARSSKRQFISRFQFLIIYIKNIMITIQKVGGGNIRSCDVLRLGKNRFKKLKKHFAVAAIFAGVFMAVWLVLPASGAEAAFSCKEL